MIRRRISAQPAVWLLALGVPLVLLGVTALRHFDGLYGQDAFAYYDYATGPVRQSLPSLRLPPPFFWPPGYPLLVALVSFVVGISPRAGQFVSLGAGLLAPLFTALLAREVWSETDDGWGLPVLAGALAALVGQLWQSSVVVMADTAGLAAATAGVWALARYGRRAGGAVAGAAGGAVAGAAGGAVAGAAGGGWLVLAAALMAYAVLTRWAYALVAIVCVAYVLWLLVRWPFRVKWRHVALAAAAVSLVLAPVWLPALQRAMLRPSPPAAPATAPPAASQQPAFAGDLSVYSWHPLNAFRRQFVTADGLLSYRIANGLWYALAPAHRYYFTPLLAWFLLPGGWAVLHRRASAPIILLLGWVAAIFVFHAGAPWQNFRFNLAHLPPLAILVAIGVQTVAGWLRRVFPVGTPHRAASGLLVLVVVAGMAWMAAGGWALTHSFIARKTADLATVAWVEHLTGGGNARLLTFNLTSTFRHYGHLGGTHELYGLEPPELAALVGDGEAVYLLIDVAEVEGQWQGRSPSLNYHWLREQVGLDEIGRARTYTLFRVSGQP